MSTLDNKLYKESNIKFNITDITFVLFFCYQFINAVFINLSINSIVLDIMLGSLMIISIIVELYRNKNRDIYFSVFIFLTTIIIFLVTANYNAEIKHWVLDNNWGVLNRIYKPHNGIYAMFVITLINNKDKMFRNLLIISFINTIYNIIILSNYFKIGGWSTLLADGKTEVITSYSMSFGYRALFIGMIFIICSIYYERAELQIMAILFIISSILYGSRGIFLPLLTFYTIFLIFYKGRGKNIFYDTIFNFFIVVIAMMVIYYTTNSKVATLLTVLFILLSNILFKKTNARIFNSGKMKIILILILVLLFSVYKDIKLNNTSLIKSRNLEYFFEGKISKSEDRVRIKNIVMSNVNDIFPFGYGAYGDRIFVGKFYTWGYSHNIVLEMLISFGLIGILILLGVILLVIFRMKKYRGDTIFMLLLLFLAISLKLLVSDSFWFSEYFWGLIGVIIITREKSNFRIEENQFSE